ncbi:MAG: hypothetical protein SWZ49_21925 [Cyanobacteriota bacterium]|nr:hypothetical protein [Cyanobacteriota bacterium]
MSFQSEELLKYLPVEIQYQEIKASEEAYRKFRLSQVRGRICCFGLSLSMAIAILHPSINQWFDFYTQQEIDNENKKISVSKRLLFVH